MGLQLSVFWSKVDKTETCWNWKGYLQPNGYAAYGSKKNRDYAHRISYRLFKGEIPNGLDIDHLCRNRKCINPEHLEAVSRRINLLRGIGFPSIEAAQTHCIHGHEFNQVNTNFNSGKRKCRACDAERHRKYRQKK
jgi:hypothetical protein